MISFLETGKEKCENGVEIVGDIGLKYEIVQLELVGVLLFIGR